MVFGGFRRFLAAIEALTSALDALVQIQQESVPALDRIDTLERARHGFEAECHGLLLKADGKLKAAASAEQRERQLKKTNTQLAAQFTDPFPEAGEEGTEPATVFPNHVAAGEAPGVPAVHLALAPNTKAHAVRAKFRI